MGLSDLTAPAVNQAIEEFDQLKRKAFLKKYKFGKAKSYFARQAAPLPCALPGFTSSTRRPRRQSNASLADIGVLPIVRLAPQRDVALKLNF
jgi:hypothetical protein